MGAGGGGRLTDRVTDGQAGRTAPHAIAIGSWLGLKPCSRQQIANLWRGDSAVSVAVGQVEELDLTSRGCLHDA